MNKEEALALYLNKSLNEIYLNMDSSYIDNSNDMKILILTEEEAKDLVRGIILKNLHRYSGEYIVNFIDINSFLGESEYDQSEILDSLAESINSVEGDVKNILILQLISDFDFFVEADTNKNNGYGGYFQSNDNEEIEQNGYLIYEFNL